MFTFFYRAWDEKAIEIDGSEEKEIITQLDQAILYSK
jgi:hypothetical protein